MRSQKTLRRRFCPYLPDLGSTAAGMDGLRRLQPDAAPSFDMLAPRPAVAGDVRAFRDLTRAARAGAIGSEGDLRERIKAKACRAAISAILCPTTVRLDDGKAGGEAKREELDGPLPCGWSPARDNSRLSPIASSASPASRWCLGPVGL